MRPVGGLVLVVFVLVALSAVASAAPRATVTVTDSAVTPPRVRVDARGSVTWRNTGARSHRIASRTGVFAPFALASGASRTIRFSRNGRHPYTVDGSRCAVVFVGVPLGAGCSGAGAGGGGGGSGQRPPAGTRNYRYDVTLRAVIKNEGSDQWRGRGSDCCHVRQWTRETIWTSTFRNLRIRVLATGSSVAGGSSLVGGPRRSTARVTETWKWFWQERQEQPVDVSCDGEMTRNAPMALQAHASNTSTSLTIDFMSSSDWEQTVSDVIGPDCKSILPPPFQTPEFTSNGIKVMGSHHLSVSFERRTGGLAAPVRQFVTGRAFTVGTATHATEDTSCDGDCQRSIKTSQRYTATFTPRR